MRQRFVRPGDELDDDDEIVLCGGRLDEAIVKADAQRMHDIYGTFGISVFALRGATIDELAQQGPLVRFAELTVVTVGALRDVGVTLEPTGRNARQGTEQRQLLASEPPRRAQLSTSAALTAIKSVVAALRLVEARDVSGRADRRSPNGIDADRQTEQYSALRRALRCRTRTGLRAERHERYAWSS